MGKVLMEITMSLDGYTTGPEVSAEAPLGRGGERLHEWMFAGRSAAEGDRRLTDRFSTIGAVIIGRRMADLGIGPWAAGAVRTLPRLPMIVLIAAIVNVAPPSIREHLGFSRTRVAVGCAGSMP
jgi:hypothetical protein